MSITQEEQDGSILLRIEGPVSIYETPEIREVILACFEREVALELDLGQVTDIDSAGIQLICSVQKSAKIKDRSFTIQHMAESVTKSFLDIGLNPDSFKQTGK
jgi:anti-anti-sigma factor